MSAVSDSGPLLRFASINRLDLLRQLFGLVVVPGAVWSEVVEKGFGRSGSVEVSKAQWIVRAIPARTQLLTDLEQKLGKGEAEAIALAVQFDDAEILLIDDRVGRRIAGELKLRLTGTAGILVLAKQSALIPAVRPLLSDLMATGLYLGEALFAETIRIAGEDVS
jgi:predicted nucleic acid-binding protein